MGASWTHQTRQLFMKRPLVHFLSLKMAFSLQKETAERAAKISPTANITTRQSTAAEH
jgi:hypothetical protein